MQPEGLLVGRKATGSETEQVVMGLTIAIVILSIVISHPDLAESSEEHCKKTEETCELLGDTSQSCW